ncbi:polysaccharide biosynthesis tyrosine autokinase [Sphingobium sp. CR2-8]|uniref:GumC family protein n=1 Tax=Sphingobium sp. CR2-8 TaxID=1306534 RepID=UPI002DBAA28D|nr:polysaccharide biosynthesis tyrosine autokinase [Sphingobium sp. CR2-8]MEC3911063.1 polysaccharide biosynthesis tyrosine autokinase [Sphingobium sp. CR2-8]
MAPVSLPARDDADLAANGLGARLSIAAHRGWLVLRRHRVILFVTMALSLLAGAIVILTSTPDYRATASIEVEDVPAGAAGSAAAQRASTTTDTETLMQTELEVLRSRALAEDVARDLSLVGTPTFFKGMDRPRPVEGVGTLSQRQVEQDAVVRLLHDNLEVELPGKSRVLRISFVSADPVLSARIANSYADSLIRADLKRGFESGVQARRFLLGELDAARKDLARAERDLAVYVARNGAPIEPGQDQPDAAKTTKPAKPPAPEGSVATRLAQLNAFRAQAAADRIAAQKRWESARRTSADTLPEVLGNGAMQQIMAERAQARAEVAEERQFRKDAHPEMREARARLSALDEQANSMASTIRASLREQYNVAVRGEQQIAREIAQLEREAQVEQGRDVQTGIMERSVDTYRMLHDSLLQRYRDMASQAGFQAGRIQPLDRAAVPTQPFSPRIGVILLLASLGGLVLGLLLVAARHMFDDAVTSADTLAERVGLPLLGAVPVTGDNPQPPDIFTPIASSLLLASADGLPRSILVTSAQEGEGKSLTLHALALALAGLGKSVLVIDGDMRRPVQHRLFRLSPVRGISEVLTGQATAQDVIMESGVAGVALLPCGTLPPNPTELLSTPALAGLLAAVRNSYDTVLIDAPPILGAGDAPLLAAQAQASLLVVEWGRNHHGGLRTAVERLRRSGGAIIGAILTKQQGRSIDYDYHRGG